jgi:hypothetical protein
MSTKKKPAPKKNPAVALGRTIITRLNNADAAKVAKLAAAERISMAAWTRQAILKQAKILAS